MYYWGHIVDLPAGFASAFSGSFAGRRFLLNFLMGHERGDFTVAGELKSLVEVWFAELAKAIPAMDVASVPRALTMFDVLAAKHFASYASATDVYSARSDLDQLSRVIDVDVLALDPTYSLLDPSVINKRKPASGTDDKFSEDLNLFVESLSGDATAIRAGATLRSSLPFSWAAPSSELTRKLGGQVAAALADKFRDLLATPHYPGKHYLNRLEYPAKAGVLNVTEI